MSGTGVDYMVIGLLMHREIKQLSLLRSRVISTLLLFSNRVCMYTSVSGRSNREATASILVRMYMSPRAIIAPGAVTSVLIRGPSLTSANR